MRQVRHAWIAAALIGAATLSPAGAMSINTPQLQSADPKAPAANPAPAAPEAEKSAKKKKKAPEKKSEAPFVNGYRHAYALIYDEQRFGEAIAELRALGRDEHPDVANLIGYASRKLGRTEDAKVWYEKALAADPRHTRTWQYYGMWHLEQGERAQAEQNLERIRLICGEGCEDYTSLRDALAGNITY